MAKQSNIQGNYNIVIQDVSKSTIKIEVNGELLEIKRQLTELKALLKKYGTQDVQYAEKVYNIDHIDEANFGIALSNRDFNGVLSKELIEVIKEKNATKEFLKNIPSEDKNNWESVRNHLKEAQRILESSFVWVISWELRRLFSIGNDRNKRVETKIDEYISHCFMTYRHSLQLVNCLFLSKLWDEKKKNPELHTSQEPIKKFFTTNRPLKLVELRDLFQTLIEIFKNNKLELPIDKIELGDIDRYMNPNSKFSRTCESLEELEAMDPTTESYGLGHCHTAEIGLSAILTDFSFFSTYKLTTMGKVEYEQMRNTPPRYIKDFKVLEKEHGRALLRLLKYDKKPTLTYAVLFNNTENAVNLFPFILDYNALISEKDFQIYSYECQENNTGLRFFSIKNETEETIYYRATETNIKEVKSEEQKMEEQKKIRLDLVIKQFEKVFKTILDEDVQFTPIDSGAESDNYDYV